MAAKESEPDSSPDSDEDVRRKFREALERKKRRTHATKPRVRHDGSDKSHGVEEPTGGRMFRRKSG